MDKERIQLLTGREIDEAMRRAGVRTPKVVKPLILSKASVNVDHEHDSITVEVRDSGKYMPLETFIESLRFDGDFAKCFALQPHPHATEWPFEVKASEGLRAGDLEAIASGKAILTGWQAETTEVVELGENEIAASDKAAIGASIEDIASGKKTIRFGV
jgi:hypothetical protein